MAGKETAEAARARLQAILDSAVDGIVTIDEHGTIGSFNAAAESMFGYRASEVVGRDVSILMPPPYGQEHRGYLESYRRTGAAKIIGVGREVAARRRDGRVFPVHISVSEARAGGRRIFTGIIRDVTGLKEAEAALRRERDFAESLVQNAQAIVLVLDPRGRVARCNRYFEELTGRAREEIEGADWFDTFLPPENRDGVRQVFRETLRDVDTSGTVNAVLTRDGETREIRWSNKVLKDERGEPSGVLCVGLDVTELREAQGRLLQSERLAAIGEMLAGLSHESRNALQQMEGCLDALASEVSSRRALDLVARLRKAQRQLRQLYDDLRAFAAPVHLRPQTCELDRLWRAIWGDLRAARRGPAPALVEESRGVDLRCEVDPFAIGQVFRNVLDNAIGFSPEGGSVTIRCAPSERDGRPCIEVAVRDQGPGFAPGHETRVFAPFYTTRSEGTGLGLAIVRRIVDAHGGEVMARNAAGGGAEVVLTLPRSQRL